MLLEFSYLSSWSVKIVSQVKIAKCVSFFHESRSVFTVQRRFCVGYGGNHRQKYQFTSGINCLIRLFAFVQENTLLDNQPLKFRWMKSEQLPLCNPYRSNWHTAWQLNDIQQCNIFCGNIWYLEVVGTNYCNMQLPKSNSLQILLSLSRLQDDKRFTAKIIFSDVTGKSNQHNLRMWWDNSHLEVNETYALSKQKIFQPFF